jgi:signal transduction histidine kinase
MEDAVRDLAAWLIQTQEEERQRLGRELHDEAGHTVLMAIFRLDLALQQLPPDAVQARDALISARASLLECSEDLHAIAFALRPRILGDLGLPAALRSLASRDGAPGAPMVEVVVQGTPRRLDAALELTAFRAVQEALTNARKHSEATLVRVVLGYRPPKLLVRIDDDGVGMLPAASADARRPGLGLAGMRERAALLGGTFAIEVRPGGGTRLRLVLPLEPAAEEEEESRPRRFVRFSGEGAIDGGNASHNSIQARVGA